MNLLTQQGRALFAAAVAVGTILLVGCGDDGSNPGGNDVGGTTPGTSLGGGGFYESVVLGGKRWMKKNLDVQTADSWCYGEGGKVNVNERDEFVTISNSEIQANCAKYGRLYTWQAAKSACQSIGWRLPDTADWRRLVEAAGGIATAGSKLKSTSGWNDYNGVSGNGTDTYGFSALPGGVRDTVGSFYRAGGYGFWWTVTEGGSENAYFLGMRYYVDEMGEGWLEDSKSFAISARCVRD
jgi:uncharacterized protein (TIGR02145 family)